MPLAIGDYVVSTLISRGATSDVMLVHNAAHTVTGIAKRLTSRFRADPHAQAQVAREVAVLRMLAGRGAPRLLAAGDDALGPWLVTERVAMDALTETARLAERERTEAVTRAAVPCLTALMAVHEATGSTGALGVVHGDVSPNNVLCGPSRGGACFIDFGLSRYDGAAPDVADALRGTVAFMAPEVARGERATTASDLFGLGLTLLYAASAARPRIAASPAVQLVMAAEEPVTAYATAAARGLPPRLQALLLSLVEDSPAARPASAREALSMTSW